MKINKWTLGLAAAGLVSLTSVQAEEASESVKTALSSTTISGYVSTSVIWAPGSGTAAASPGRSYDTAPKFDGFNLDVINLTIEKPLDEGEWSAGYKAELLFGPDANAYLTTSTGPASATSDFAIKQAYVALRAPIGNGIDIKLGVWDTLIGYEVFNSGDNLNYGRSFGYFLEPTAHTGIQAAYKFNDIVSAAVGVANNGFGTATINARTGIADSTKSYLGTVTLTAPSDWGFIGGSTLTLGAVDTAVGTKANDVINYYVGTALKTPIESLTVGASWDYVAHGVANDSYANAFALYASWKATEKLKINTRIEYANGSTTTFGIAPTPGDDDLGVQLGAITGTLDYSLWENVISRLEVRWDTSLSNDRPYSAGSGAVVAPAAKNLVTVALNVIYKF